MGKDPAFLFYSKDFITGVCDLTMEERGQYITLLCLQHQKGHLSEKTIRLSVGSCSVDVLKKFEQDKEGNFFNKVLEEKIEERTQFVSSRRSNGMKGGRPKASGYPNGKPKNNHTGNGNGIGIGDEYVGETGNFFVPEMFEIFKKAVPNYPGSKTKDYKPLLSIAQYFCEVGGLTGSAERHREKVIEAWKPVCLVIAKDKFYATKSLLTISNHIQEILQNSTNGKQGNLRSQVSSKFEQRNYEGRQTGNKPNSKGA